MASLATSLIGPVLGGIGGALSKRSSDKANRRAADQAAFKPFNINGAGGNVTFGPNGQANVEGDAQSRMFQQGFGDVFSQIQAGQAGNQGAINTGNQFGANLGNFFNQANAQGDPSSAMNAANQFAQFSNNNAQFGQQAGQNANFLSNQFGQAQGGRNEGLAQSLFGQAGNVFGNSNFDANVADQLQRQRTFARPAEERAVNSKFQNLFNRGQLGSTGGAQQIGELALAQENADINRVNSANAFGNQLTQQNRQFGLQNLAQGQSFRGQDDAFNASRAQLFGNQAQNFMNFGQNAGQQGMGAIFAGNELNNTRGQQRLANAGQIFGFGQQADQANFQRQLGAFQANSQGNTDLRNLIAMGGNLGAAQARAGANQGIFTARTGGSAAGSFLSGLGEAFS